MICRYDNLEYVEYRLNNKSEYVNYEKKNIRQTIGIEEA